MHQQVEMLPVWSTGLATPANGVVQNAAKTPAPVTDTPSPPTVSVEPRDEGDRSTETTVGLQIPVLSWSVAVRLQVIGFDGNVTYSEPDD